MLRQAVQSISDLIRRPGLINLDFADVSTVMRDAGLAHMGVGRAAGKGKAEEAARLAISSPLLETSIEGARGILVNITASLDIGLEEVEQAANLIKDYVHPDAATIFGAILEESMDDELQVTVIATGFEEKQEEPVQPAAPVQQRTQTQPAQAPAAAPAASKSAEIRSEFERLFGEPLFTGGGSRGSEPKGEEPAKVEKEDDPFADIIKIFDNK